MNLEDLDSEDYGHKFSDYFQYKSVVGKGAFGIVVSATSIAEDKEYAVKIIKKQNLSQSNWQRLRQEAQLLSSLKHDNIVKFIDTIETTQRILLVMEMIKGGQLKEFIDMRQAKKRPITDEEASVIMKNILSAVQYMHSKEIIHRDLKPENILIDDWEALNSVKIADFGLSAQFSGEFSTQNFRQTCGTMIYMAPEQASEKIYSKPVDIWSCGLIMYILLSNGKHPLYTKHDTPKTYFAKVRNPKWDFGDFFTPLAKSFFLKMMNTDPVIRYRAEDALKHPWITRKFDDPIPLSGHEVMSNFSLEQTFTRIIKALYLTSHVGTHSGDEAEFEEYKDLAQQISKENQGNKESNDKAGVFGQYNNLQNLISMLSPKPSAKPAEGIRGLERKKSDKREHSEPTPAFRKPFLEESKLQDSKNEGEENESPLIKRFKSKKTFALESTQSDSPPEKSEIEPKIGSIRLFTAAADQTRSDIDESKSKIDIKKVDILNAHSLRIATESTTSEIATSMKSYLSLGLPKSTKAQKKPISLFKLSFEGEQEFESENLLKVAKNRSERVDKLLTHSARQALSTTKIVANTYSSNGSDESSDGSTDSRNPSSKADLAKIVKKSPFFHNSSKRTDLASGGSQTPKAKAFMIRAPSQRVLQTAKSKLRDPLRMTTTETPKAVINTEEDGFSARMKSIDNSKSRIRFTSQTPSSSYKKHRTIIEFSDSKAYTVKTFSSKSIKSTQETPSLNSLTFKDSAFGRSGRKAQTKIVKGNTATSINLVE